MKIWLNQRAVLYHDPSYILLEVFFPPAGSNFNPLHQFYDNISVTNSKQCTFHWTNFVSLSAFMFTLLNLMQFFTSCFLWFLPWKVDDLMKKWVLFSVFVCEIVVSSVPGNHRYFFCVQICFQVTELDFKPGPGSISWIQDWRMEMFERYCCEVQKGFYLLFRSVWYGLV